MRSIALTALGAVMLSVALPTPAVAQELPMKSADFWDVSAIKVEDGHGPKYLDFLASEWRKRQDFAVSKGWIRGYHVLSNVHARDGEPDLYLITVSDRVATPADDLARERDMNAFLKSTTRDSAAGSGARASYRRLKGSMLLQEMRWAR